MDQPGATEDEIRAEVRHTIETYAPGGGFTVYGATLDLFNPAAYAPGQKLGILIEECMRYGADFYKH